jgi:phytoene dehydrogenase-like protein
MAFLRPLPLTVDFHGEPAISPLGYSDEWILLTEWTFRVSSDDGELLTLTVPDGFVTDLASVPRLPAAYLLFGNRARRAAILHDWLYTERFPREWADAVFFAAMRHEVNPPAAYAMWLAVRVGGGSYYREAGTSSVQVEN